MNTRKISFGSTHQEEIRILKREPAEPEDLRSDGSGCIPFQFLHVTATGREHDYSGD